ncbi:amino acid--tRNA ligase-related protein [Kitasatospora sp. NPDC098663]|uniref:amino acid--tRNA ligase-related protein n=1 Tax=Kitasatospora sp. NPDC098663 TaxID=3364096 RepID=UPI00382A580D
MTTTGLSTLADAIAATHDSTAPTTWDAPTELLGAAAVLFTTHPADGADELLAGIARLLSHGPHPAVTLHAGAPARGPRELDILHHALAAAAEPGRPPWPHGPADPARLAAATHALTAAIPCRLIALRAATVIHLLHLLPDTDGHLHRDLIRRTTWLLDPRTDDPTALLLTLTAPDDPLAPAPRSRTHTRERHPQPLPLADWDLWPAPDQVLTLSGRITAVRTHSHVAFADLAWDRHDAQLAFDPAAVADLHAGDLVTVRGTCSTSRTGRPTLFVRHLEHHEPGAPPPLPDSALLTPLLGPLRAHLAAGGFRETISPVLTDGYFGGAARPFTTWAHAAGRRQYLRVTTELDLLAVIATGTTRCYEIGPSFRNEGQRGRPAVEFVMLEAYAADLTLDQATAYLADLVTATTGLAVPLTRRTFDDAFREITGIDSTDTTAVRALASERTPYTAEHTDDPDRLARRLWRHSVRQQLRGLTAITDIPGPASPLIAGTGRQAQRIWLYADGLELAEIAANERDAARLARSFTAQFAADRHVAHRTYQHVIDLYDCGLPPCVGLGMSVTRLASLRPVPVPAQRRSPVFRTAERTP